jgi:hypothetical protein
MTEKVYRCFSCSNGVLMEVPYKYDCVLDDGRHFNVDIEAHKCIACGDLSIGPEASDLIEKEIKKVAGEDYWEKKWACRSPKASA